MATNEKVDFESLYKEVLNHYFGDKYHVDANMTDGYKIEKIEACTIDEYIYLLKEGYFAVAFLKQPQILFYLYPEKNP